jgi:hypothetical protein
MPDLKFRSIGDEWEQCQVEFKNVLAYIDRSKPPFPIFCKADAVESFKDSGRTVRKYPALPSWSKKQESDSISEQDRWGFILKENDLVIVIQPSNFFPHDNVIKRFMEDIGVTFESPIYTFVWRISTHKLAMLFKIPTESEEEISKNHDRYHGIQFLTAGIDVEGPYSDSRWDLMETVIECGSPDRLQEVPEDLLKWLRGYE